MKKFAQSAILVAGLIGLSACAGQDVWTPYGSRTAGEGKEFAGKVYDSSNDALMACQERVRRLESMNRSCYRK